jgi:hypothetical protein
LLSRPDRRDDVTQIALGLGFAHTGRFVAAYRQALGESSSATRRRATRELSSVDSRHRSFPMSPCKRMVQTFLRLVGQAGSKWASSAEFKGNAKTC